jgi:hypothetical protein
MKEIQQEIAAIDQELVRPPACMRCCGGWLLT